MAFCSNCGAQIDDNAAVCSACGAPQNNNGAPQYNNNANGFNGVPMSNVQGGDYTAQMNPNDIQQNKVMAVLAYIGILFLVPLLAAPNSPYARFHTNQGLVLFLTDIAIGIVSTIFAFIPFVGWMISGLLGIAVFVFMILGIVNAASGVAKELPLIGKLRIIK